MITEWDDLEPGLPEEAERIGKKTCLTVVIYDISDNKRRQKMSKLLSGYGHRVQRSAFECVLTRSQYEKIMLKARSIIDEKCDLLRIYKLAGNTEVTVFGNIGLLDDDDCIII